MKKLIILSMLLCSYILCGAQATTITIENQTPGWLSSKINYGDQQTLQSLTVTGYLNSDDLKFIGTLMKTHNLINTLDISDCQIVDSNGALSNELETNVFDITITDSIGKLVLPISLEKSDKCLNELIVDTLVVGGENMPVLEKYMFFGGNVRCRHLIIREGVTEISNNAFSVLYTYAGRELESVELPNSLRTIGKSAFQDNINLRDIILPDSIETIEKEAFFGIAYVPDTIRAPKNIINWNYCFKSKNNQVFYFDDKVETIYNYYTNVSSSGSSTQYCFVSGMSFVLHMKKATPPRLAMMPNTNALAKTVVYVPKGAGSLYRAADYWKAATIIEEYVNINFYSDLSISVGDEYNLNSNYTFSTNISGLNKADIKWSVSDESLIGIQRNENGDLVLHGKKAGQAYVYAEFPGYPDSKDSCVVNINQPVTGVNLNVAELVIYDIGTQSQLVATVLPDDATNKNITWKSSDESVCYISNNGTIIATGYGTAIIIVTTEDGGHVAYCNVKVEPSSIAISDLIITPETLSINQGETYQLELTILPENATNKTIVWKSSDINIAIVDENGLISAINPGVASITATTSDGTNITAECQLTSVAGVDGIEVDLERVEVERYNQYGQRLKCPTKGINIIRYDDGTVSKEIVK